MKPQDFALFYAGCKGEMRTKKLPIGEGDLPDELLVAVTDFEANTGKTIDQYETAAEGIVAFREHLDSYQPPTMYEVQTATITINTSIGSVAVTVKPVAGHIQSAIDAVLRDLEASGLSIPKSEYVPEKQTQNQQSNGTVEEWAVEGFSKRLDTRSNEIRYRVHGGRWSNFGVAVYQEALKQYPFIAEIAGQDKIVAPPFAGMMAKVSLKPDGKPKRLEGLRW